MKILKKEKIFERFIVGQELTVLEESEIRAKGKVFLKQMPLFTEEMFKYCGKKVRVFRITSDERAKIDLDNHCFIWAPFYFKEYYL